MYETQNGITIGAKYISFISISYHPKDHLLIMHGIIIGYTLSYCNILPIKDLHGILLQYTIYFN
jgi:hypothetical protein